MAVAIAVALAGLILALCLPWSAPGTHPSLGGVVAALQGEQLRPDGERWTAALVRLLRLKVDYRGRLARELAVSGLEITLEDVWAFKVIMPVFAALLGAAGYLQGPSAVKLAILISAPLWYWAPDKVVAARADEYRKMLHRSIPSFLQALAVLTEAGLNLMPAIAEYAGRVSGPLARELQQVLVETRMGVPQAEALLRLAERLEVPDLHMAVSALVQGLERGASGIAAICRDQATEVWQKRRDSARELGQKASVKLFVPLFLLVLPTLLLFMLGPAIYGFFTNM